MGISATYIGVIIILLVLIGFVLSIVITLTNTAGKKIRHDMSRVLSSYDYLIDQKMKEYNNSQKVVQTKPINILDVEDSEPVKEVIVKNNSLLSANFIKWEASHRISSLASGYDSIKNEFREYTEKIDENVAKHSQEGKRTEFDEALLRLKDAITVENVYDLSLLSHDKQLEFFKETLKPEDKIVFDKYLETHKKKFNSIDFYDWIKIGSMSVYEKVVVRTGNKELKSDYDSSICEGCQIIVGNKLYDYSISKRDIQ